MFLRIYLICFLFFVSSFPVLSQSKVQRWDRFEITLNGPQAGNPFKDVDLTAVFTNGAKTVKVTGFYDGEGVYRVRFMPDTMGVWTYRTASNQKSLNAKTGRFECVAAEGANHGPVKVSEVRNFRYADGKRYYPFGTTVYALTHQPDTLEQQTLQTLSKSPFNKVRLCVFPKFYSHAENEPPLYPFERKDANNQARRENWDFTRFNPVFFRHLEQRIDDLKNMGIEADLIIFHPYDKGRWGFDSLGMNNDLAYIKYLTSRLSSFRNVWWSLANEFDYIKTKPRDAWDVYTKAVVAADPYKHLCSIHNGSVYYDLGKPEYTHVSIQNGSVVEDFGRAVLLRDVFEKPMVYDEVCYEGDLSQRWGHLSGEEMTEAFWQGTIAGTYVTHGETYNNPQDVVFWARGGKLVGSSPARIGFLRQLVEDAPGPLSLADPWKDHQTAMADSSYYLVYFGKNMPGEWALNLPRKSGPSKGKKFSVEIVDTWNMTIERLPETFEAGTASEYRIFDQQRKTIRLPKRPYLAIRLRAL